MAHPLVMTGPGGDFVSRLEVRGQDLVRVSPNMVAQTRQQNSDTESAGSYSQYARFRRGRVMSTVREEARSEEVTRGSDIYEHTATPVGLRLYRADGSATAPARSAQPIQPQSQETAEPAPRSTLASIATAVETWLAAQQQAMTELARAVSALRVTRPTPAQAVARDLAVAGIRGIRTPSHDLTPSEELEHHDEPHAQAVAHTYASSGPSTGSRLFADYAGVGRRVGGEQGHGLRARRGVDQKGSLATRPQQGSLFGAD